MLTVATFYRFVALEHPAELQKQLLQEGQRLHLRGTILLAPEGLNATLCGTADALQSFLQTLQSDTRFSGLPIKYSQTQDDDPVFLRFKVKLKREIVTMGVPDVDVAAHTATHVPPAAFNELLRDPKVRVIDVRNGYETGIGSFTGAQDPGTDSFREFPEYVERELGEDRDQPVAMFCTGGIRCEKASAYLVEQGFSNVSQLDGGILRYLEEIPAEQSLWHGDCFVFDQRVTVDAQLQPGDYAQCFACRRPVAPEQLAAPEYVEGVSCPACIGRPGAEGFTERQRQIELAQARGQAHIGPDAQSD